MLNPDGRLWIDWLSGGLEDSGRTMSAADGERIVDHPKSVRRPACSTAKCMPSPGSTRSEATPWPRMRPSDASYIPRRPARIDCDLASDVNGMRGDPVFATIVQALPRLPQSKTRIVFAHSRSISQTG
jgi:hypothetical protein